MDVLILRSKYGFCACAGMCISGRDVFYVWLMNLKILMLTWSWLCECTKYFDFNTIRKFPLRYIIFKYPVGADDFLYVCTYHSWV